MFESIYSQLGTLAVVLSCGFAIFRGDKLEQAAGTAFFIGSIAGVFAQTDAGTLTPPRR